MEKKEDNLPFGLIDITLKLSILILGALGICLGYHAFQYPKTWECGSSTITDLGWSFDSPERYIVNVGNVDLTKDKINSWELCMLPQKELFCGLKITLPNSPAWDAAKIFTEELIISMRLYDSQGQIIFKESGNLKNDWIWSGPFDTNTAFVYLNNSFSPSENSQYQLDIEVISSKKAKDVLATVMLKDFGG